MGRQILKHEMVHIEQKHSWDKIFVEIITSLFWFNPFFYLIKKEINLIHEYLADKKALKNSDTKAFAQMLLASHFSGKQFPATSPFLSSNLKKRLTMLKKSKTKFSYARKILVLPILFTIAFVYLVNAKNKEIAKSNSEIESLISTLKMDTIKSNGTQTQEILKEVAYGTDATKLYEENPELFIDNDTINKEADKKFNSPEFQQKMKAAELKIKEAERKFNSPEFQQKMKAAELKVKEAEEKFNSPEFQQKMKASELKVKEAEKNFQYAQFKQNIEGAEIIAIEPSTYQPNSGVKFSEETDIFIDGKAATRENMNKLNPNIIESVSVYKKGFGGKKKGEIHIKLK